MHFISSTNYGGVNLTDHTSVDSALQMVVFWKCNLMCNWQEIWLTVMWLIWLFDCSMCVIFPRQCLFFTPVFLKLKYWSNEIVYCNSLTNRCIGYPITVCTLPAFMEVITKMNHLSFFSLDEVTGIESVNVITQRRQIYCFAIFIEVVTWVTCFGNCSKCPTPLLV